MGTAPRANDAKIAISWLNARDISFFRLRTVNGSIKPMSPVGRIAIVEVTLVPPAAGSRRYDASNGTGPEVLLKAIRLFGS